MLSSSTYNSFLCKFITEKTGKTSHVMGCSWQQSVGLGQSPEAEVRSNANYEPLKPMEKLRIKHYANDYERRIHLFWSATLQCLCKFFVEEGRQQRQDHGMTVAVAERGGNRSARG